VIEIPLEEAIEEVYEAEEQPAQPFDDDEFEVQPPSGQSAQGDRQPCPMCGEMILKDAIKCRFCGEVFDQTLAKTVGLRGPGGRPGESVEEAAQRLVAEKHDKTTAIQIFVTSLIGCFSPIIAVYGIIFLMRRPYSFPYKGLAIAGTIIHGCWTLLLIASLVLSQIQQ